jgi:hypothetical protein
MRDHFAANGNACRCAHAATHRDQVATELPMNTLARWLFFIATMLAAAPAAAQTYDPSFPVCIQTFGTLGNTLECRFVSMDQCRLSAWGGAAQCISNPYFSAAPGRMLAGRRRR